MKKLLFEEREDLGRIVLLEKDNITQCKFIEKTNKPKVGEIYLAVVSKIVPAMNCAFLDLGYDKKAYLHLNKFKKQIKNGDEFLVEVIKEEIGEKGATVTKDITIGGVYSVLCKDGYGVKVSKKIRDKAFLSSVEENIEAIDGFSIVVRSAAEKVDIEEIQEEIFEIKNNFEEILKKSTFIKAPKLMYEPRDIFLEMLGNLNEEVEIICDKKENLIKAEDFLEKHYKSLYGDNFKEKLKFKLYDGSINLLHYYSLEKKILSLINRRVELENKAYLIFDNTEAMRTIDVNSGGNINNKTMGDTVFKCNIDAAKEIARQVILRDLSGIIIVDFIDMKRLEDKKKVIEILREAFKKDRNKVRVYNFTELNLVQITRERRGKTLFEYLEEENSLGTCLVKRINFSYLSFLIKNEIKRIRQESKIDKINLEINKLYYFDIMESKEEFLKYLEINEENINISFKDVEYFSITLSAF